MGRVLGVDFGLVRIGLAISDKTRMIAFALGKIENKKQFSATLKEFSTLLAPYKDEIDVIIIGNPLHLNGRAGPMSEAVAFFKSQLEAALPYKMLLWDERLSSSQAEKVLREADLSRKKRKEVVDSVAATIVLQNYLDTLSLTQ